MDCTEIEDLSGAYALGAVTEDELRAVEQHLRTCGKHAELAELLVVAAGLAALAPEREPPVRLKARLMDSIRAEVEPARPQPRASILSGLRAWLTGGRGAYALAGGLAIVVLALAGWNIALQVGKGGTESQVFMLANGSATGEVIYVPDQQLALMRVDGLPQLPPDKTYQVWSITGSRPTSIGFLSVAGGQALAVLRADLGSADTIAVTVEPAGGSAQPTAQPVLQAPL